MPKISIIYHIYTNTKNLKNSLNSLTSLDNLDDLELIIIDDYATNEVCKIINHENFKQIKNIKYVSCSQNLGHSYSYNLGTKLAASKYVYYSGSECIFPTDFITKINFNLDLYENPDILIFNSNQDRFFSIHSKIKLSENNVFNHLTPEIIYETDWEISNKVYRNEFLLKNKIKMIENHFYPAIFIIDALTKFKKIVFVNDEVVQIVKNLKPSYNLYDLLFQIEEFYAISKKRNLVSDNYRNTIEFLAIKIGLYDFVKFILKSDLTNPEKETAIIAAFKRIIKIYPKFQTNENIKLINEAKWQGFFSKFKAKLSWVEKEFDTK